MALPGDPGRWLVSDLAAIEERIARGSPSSADKPDPDEQSLDQSEKRYRHLVENCLGLICTHDLDGTVQSVNPAAAESLGYEPHEGIGRSLREFLSPGTRHLFDAYLEDMMRATTRGATLTRQLLAVGGRQVTAHDLLDVNAIISGLQESFRRLVGPRISLVLLLDRALPGVEGDRAQIEQALLNLVANARAAIEGGGTVTIKTSATESTGVQNDTKSILPPRVLIAVSDTGRGMNDHTKAHLFEPFFTTKSPDTSTGLGLPTVYGIVYQHGGGIWVESEPGSGATFTMSLPPQRCRPHCAPMGRSPLGLPPQSRKRSSWSTTKSRCGR